MLGKAEPVQVGEGPRPQAQEDVLGGPHQPVVGELAQLDAAQHQDDGRHAQHHRPAQVDAVGGDGEVHDELHKQRDQELAAGHRQRHEGRLPCPLAQFGRGGQAPT